MPAPPSRPFAGPAWHCRAKALEAGLHNVEWPARLQRLTGGAVVAAAKPERKSGSTEDTIPAPGW